MSFEVVLNLRVFHEFRIFSVTHIVFETLIVMFDLFVVFLF